MQRDLWGGKQKISESDVLRDVQQYLKLRHIFSYRQNSGAYKPDGGGFVRYGHLGAADLCCIYPGGRMWQLETKAPGGKLSDGQIIFLKEVRAHGGVVLVCEGLDDVDKCLKDAEYIGLDRYKRLIV